MSIPPRVNDRRARIDKLIQLRARIEAEIGAIEAEIRDEITAIRRAKEAAKHAQISIRNRPVAQCGTDGGYYRHRRTLKEPACDACKLAHRVTEAQRQARRKEREAAA